MAEPTRLLLRSLPSLVGIAPVFDRNALPADPVELFLEWFRVAIESGVPEPHAMTLSTVDQDGLPDARVLVLKDVDERGWAFASTKSSVKGGQLRGNPKAAMTFWWQPLVRSVRVRGVVVEAPPSESLADLHARSADAQKNVQPDDWAVWRLIPVHVEFWQGSVDRQHTRVLYTRHENEWHLDS